MNPLQTITLEILRDENPDALLADGFEEAFVGICRRFGQPPLAAYDRGRCIDVLMARDGMSEDEAEEFFEYNVIGAWVGDHTPVFLDLAAPVDVTSEALEALGPPREVAQMCAISGHETNPAIRIIQDGRGLCAVCWQKLKEAL